MNLHQRRQGRMILTALAALLLATACMLPIRILEGLKRTSAPIAYLGMDYNIYTIDKDGSQLAAVTTDAHVEGDTVRVYDLPVWSPDSQSLAFAGYSGPKDLSQPPIAGLFVAQQDGSKLTQVYFSN